MEDLEGMQSNSISEICNKQQETVNEVHFGNTHIASIKNSSAGIYGGTYQGYYELL